MGYGATTRGRLTSAIAFSLAVSIGLMGCTSAKQPDPPSAHASPDRAPGAAASRGDEADAPVETFTLTAVGDTIMGAAPQYLPPNNAKDFFAPVQAALRSDLQMANLEEPLTSVARSSKCGSSLGKTCFAFRSPPSYAKVLKSAGFQVVNLANNHTLDFGEAGHEETEEALDRAGVKYTGPPGMITTITVKGIQVAVVGFAPYPWANDLRNIASAAALVRKASAIANVVIVQMHVGGEGAGYQHVKSGAETFLGENRGNAIAFSHAMVDAGADIVIGHGPHVLRAMEFYKGHLIAYSLGNFAGYHALSSGGVTGVSMILRATVQADGSFVSARIVPTSMVPPGVPRMDPKKRAVSVVRALTRNDFPRSGAQIATDGSITPAT